MRPGVLLAILSCLVLVASTAHAQVPLVGLPGGPWMCQIELGDVDRVNDDALLLDFADDFPPDEGSTHDLRLVDGPGGLAGTFVDDADGAEHQACTFGASRVTLCTNTFCSGDTVIFSTELDGTPGHTEGDCLYLDRDRTGGDEPLTFGDVRLADCSFGPGYAAGTYVVTGDQDLAVSAPAGPFPEGSAFRWADNDGNGIVDEGDQVYLVLRAGGGSAQVPQPGDIRLVGARAPAPLPGGDNETAENGSATNLTPPNRTGESNGTAGNETGPPASPPPPSASEDPEARRAAEEARQEADEAREAAQEAAEQARGALEAAEGARETTEENARTADEVLDALTNQSSEPDGVPGPAPLLVLLAVVLAARRRVQG